MPACKTCQAPIRWRRDGTRWVGLNLDGTPHHPCGASRCRQCEQPIRWVELEGKPQCFEPDGTTLHNDVCPNREACSHCGQKIRWASIEGKWVAFDARFKETLHWTVCLKNPEAAKAYVQRAELLAMEVGALRNQVLSNPAVSPSEVIELRRQVAELQRKLREQEEAHRRELNYRDVELRRLTKKVEMS